MNQIKFSKNLDSIKKRILWSKLKLSNRCFPIMQLSPPPSVNLESFSLHQLHQIHHATYFTSNRKQLNPRTSNQLNLLLTVEEQGKQTIHNILQSFTKPQLIEILEEATFVHPNILHSILSIIDHNPSHRKIFIKGLGPKTTSESLYNFLSQYGEVEEAKVIFDRATGNSKGYGFVTFKNVEAFLLALENPSKKVDGFVSFTSICVESDNSAGKNSTNISSFDGEAKEKFKRKIRVENVPMEMTSETLLNVFEKYGDIVEGPGGFDMGTGKSRGFAYILYKNEESAKAALAERVKFVDGFGLVCKRVLRETEKNTRNVGLRLVESLPLPLRMLVLPVFCYNYVHYSRELVSYNCYYQNELVMTGGGQFGTGMQEPSSSIWGPVPCISGDTDSGTSSSGK